MVDIVQLLTEDAASLVVGLLPPVWGVYFNGIPVVPADSVASFTFNQTETISDFPVEGGGFQSFNKVTVPFDARFRFATGGSLLRRQAMIDALRALVSDTNIYDVVTPDQVYLGVNITKVAYSQAADAGATLIVADVWTLQVQTAPALQILSSVQNPTDSGQVNGGVVQAITASVTQGSLLSTITGLL